MGRLEGLDRAAFLFSEVFANEKFMGLFSVLFGAGVVLFTDRIRSKGKSEAAWHYRRNGWLLLFGLAHAYLLWNGDILVTYAICSVWLFLFRGWSVRGLLIAAGVFLGGLAGQPLLRMVHALLDPRRTGWPPRVLVSDAASLAQEVDAYRGSWLDQMAQRIPGALAIQTALLLFVAPRATGMMLPGMALYKAADVLTGGRDRQWNGRLALIGLGFGTLISGFGVWQNEAVDWSMEYSFFTGSVLRTLGMVPLVLGYIGGILWLCEGKIGPWLERRLAPVGRMANDELPHPDHVGHHHHVRARPGDGTTRWVGQNCGSSSCPSGGCKSCGPHGGWSTSASVPSSGSGARPPTGRRNRCGADRPDPNKACPTFPAWRACRV